jgi:hypothetical protein
MSDPRWFKLLVRAIGVLVLAQAAPNVVATVGWLISMFTTAGPGGGDFFDYGMGAVLSLVGTALELAIGVYLLRGAPALVRYCIRQVGRRCAACDYDLQGLGGKCPECGLVIEDGGART